MKSFSTEFCLVNTSKDRLVIDNNDLFHGGFLRLNGQLSEILVEKCFNARKFLFGPSESKWPVSQASFTIGVFKLAQRKDYRSHATAGARARAVMRQCFNLMVDTGA